MLQPNTNISSKYCQKTRYNYVRSSVFWGSSFTGKERDSETGFSYFGARYYDSDLMTGWLSVDPMADKYPSLSPYAYCGWNPIRLVDPDGRMMDEPQRRAAIAKAKEYEMANRVDKTKPSGKGNSKNTYGYAKGKPGQIVDCSGLVSECIMAGGEENPVGKYPGGGGVKQIAKGTEKLSNTNLAEEGNLIIFNDQSHVGIIVGINYENEEITSFTIIHSSGKPERGYSGPNYTTIPIEGSKYWKIDGVYKWDTKPDYLINLNEVKIIDNRITKTDEK